MPSRICEWKSELGSIPVSRKPTVSWMVLSTPLDHNTGDADLTPSKPCAQLVSPRVFEQVAPKQAELLFFIGVGVQLHVPGLQLDAVLQRAVQHAGDIATHQNDQSQPQPHREQREQRAAPVAPQARNAIVQNFVNAICSALRNQTWCRACAGSWREASQAG